MRSLLNTIADHSTDKTEYCVFMKIVFSLWMTLLSLFSGLLVDVGAEISFSLFRSPKGETTLAEASSSHKGYLRKHFDAFVPGNLTKRVISSLLWSSIIKDNRQSFSCLSETWFGTDSLNPFNIAVCLFNRQEQVIFDFHDFKGDFKETRGFLPTFLCRFIF